MTNNVMIVIERLDDRPSAVILSIAAVRFDLYGEKRIVSDFQVKVDIDSCLSRGRTMSGQNLLWMLDQSDDYRQRVLFSDFVHLPDALQQVAEFLQQDDNVWCQCAATCTVTLQDAFRGCGMNVPWPYWRSRSMQPVELLFGEEHSEIELSTDSLDTAYQTVRKLQRYAGAIQQLTTAIAH